MFQCLIEKNNNVRQVTTYFNISVDGFWQNEVVCCTLNHSEMSGSSSVFLQWCLIEVLEKVCENISPIETNSNVNFQHKNIKNIICFQQKRSSYRLVSYR